MIKQAYINGFMRKCAEHGVDGRRLLKQAGLIDWIRSRFRRQPQKETFDPEQRPDLIPVKNDEGTFYVPRAWDEREPPTAWLKDTSTMGASSGLGMFDQRPLTVSDFGSAASTTNRPSATWSEQIHHPEVRPINSFGYRKAYTETRTHPYWKNVVLPDGTQANVPASGAAENILKTFAGPAFEGPRK